MVMDVLLNVNKAAAKNKTSAGWEAFHDPVIVKNTSK
jgi:hypothetical protein